MRERQSEGYERKQETGQGGAYVNLPQNAEQDEAFGAFSASIPIRHIERLCDAEEDIITRAPKLSKWGKRGPCHAALFDVDGLIADTEIKNHMAAFREAIGGLLISKERLNALTDIEWDYFNKRCFERADKEACLEILKKGIEAEEWARKKGYLVGADCDFSSISEIFLDYVRGETKGAPSTVIGNEEIMKDRAEQFQLVKIEAMELIQKREGVTAIPGVIGLLCYLRSWDIPCIPCTGSPRRTAVHTLYSLGVNGLFTSIVGDEDYAHGKPNKECFAQGAYDAAAASVFRELKDGWDTVTVPENMVIMAFDNRPNGVQAALQVDAIGKRGTAFLVNYELNSPGGPVACSDPDEAHRALEKYQEDYAAPGANPAVLVPHPGAIELRDTLIALFGFPGECERTILDPMTGQKTRRVVTGKEYYDITRRNVYDTVKAKWQAVGHPVMPYDEF